eukprot:2096038-Rhodomonas_salina.1
MRSTIIRYSANSNTRNQLSGTSCTDMRFLVFDFGVYATTAGGPSHHALNIRTTRAAALGSGPQWCNAPAVLQQALVRPLGGRIAPASARCRICQYWKSHRSLRQYRILQHKRLLAYW